jgi:ACDE family multidrug resistance protein
MKIGNSSRQTAFAGLRVVERKIELADFRPAKAGVHNFALLAACEATARSVLISVYPILMYRSLGDAKTVSEVYLGIGLCSLALALFTPFFGRFIARRYLYTLGGVTMLGGNVVGVVGGLPFIPLAVLMNSLALVVLTICFSAYLLDYVERTSMGKNESLRLLYSGAAWSIGPFLGVWMMDKQPLAPFFVSSAAVLCLLGYFWYLRLGNGKVIAKALQIRLPSCRDFSCSRCWWRAGPSRSSARSAGLSISSTCRFSLWKRAWTR